VEFDRLSSKYFGATAKQYESRRLDRKWIAEQQTVEELVRDVPDGSKVLDAPVGTGRLIPLLGSRSLVYCGLDVSVDMLAEARERAEECDAHVELRRGDLRSIPFPGGSFDLVICLRFLNWVDSEGVRDVVRELSRVSRRKLLVGVRYLTPTNQLRTHGGDVLRRFASSVGLPSLRTRRWGIILHKKGELETIFAGAGLNIVEERLIERRWDCTDYVFYSLEKASAA
jgi:ubiquinone/menaquinone biosynthesis C-methylase UbiE